MLKMLVKPTAKKIKKARIVYETYQRTGTLHKTRAATGHGIDTIRRYIALIEDIDGKHKLSSKDRYYSTKNEDTEPQDAPGETIIGEVMVEDREETGKIEKDTIINQSTPSLKEIKDKIVGKRLGSIAWKYLDYLDTPSESKLRKTSLKDRAVIAGILLDKKILLEHKQADVIKNRSIIFNLFGNNRELSKFIEDSAARQKKLEAREPKEVVK